MAITDAQFQAWLRAEATSRVLLAELSHSAGTKYLSSGVFISKPADTPANQPYDDCITAVPQFTAMLFDGLEGYTVPAWGDLLASNFDFGKDAWLDFAWDGWPVKLLFGDASWPRADFRPILTGTIAEMTAPDGSTVRWAIKDKQWSLNGPLQPNLIGEPVLVSGTTYRLPGTVLTSIEAVWDNGVLLTPVTDYSTDLPALTFTLTTPAVGRVTAEFSGDTTAKGEVIPLCYGTVFNITPLLIDANINRFQAHAATVFEFSELREDGIPLAFSADLPAATATLSQGTAGGVITADVKGAAFGGIFETTTGHIMRRLLLTRLTQADINTDSLAAFIRTCPQTVGIYVKERRNLIDVLDELVRSVGGFYTPGRDGRLLFGRMEPPTGSPVLTLTEDDVIHNGIRLVKQSVPLATVRLGYGRNYTLQSKLNGAVTSDRRDLYTTSGRTVSRNNEAVKAAHLLALEPVAKQTTLMDALEAAIEAERLLALWGVVRKTFEVDCRIAPLTTNLGEVVHLTHSRYGLAAGVLLRIIGIRENIIDKGVTLTLWG